MTFEDVMTELENLGTAQNIKIYRRHGATQPMFGVSFANFEKLRKKLKNQHDLGMQLWNSGNMDAQILALMIIDGARFPADEIDDQVKKQTCYMVSDAFVSNVVMLQEGVNKRLSAWTRSKREYVKRAGYSILSNQARSADSLPDQKFLKYLDRIEQEIHESPNRAKQMMNITVLNIGLRNDALHEAALATAKRIGPVDVDHGDTSCKTYDVGQMLSDETYMTRARKSLKRAHGKRK